jgi:ferritin-like metal-binding protein YciE
MNDGSSGGGHSAGGTQLNLIQRRTRQPRARGVLQQSRSRALGIFTPDVNNLRELYVTMLQRTLNSEKQIVEKGLPAMIEKATSPELKEAFRTHLEESKLHVSRLERILDAEEGEVSDTKCKVTAQLISSAESNIGDAANEGIRDVILIAAGNQVEHHEIAVYGTLRTWAEVLGETEDAAVLEKTLIEEENADELLSELSQQINVEADVSEPVAS